MTTSNGTLICPLSHKIPIFFSSLKVALLYPLEIQNDQQVLRKRKTELGGMFSVATVILFLGLVTV
jgi:hypothetical protein